MQFRLLVLFLLFGLPTSGKSESIAVSGSLGVISGLFTESGQISRALSEPLEIHLSVHSGKPLQVRFESYQSKNWIAELHNAEGEVSTDEAQVLLLQGQAVSGYRELPAAGAVYQGASGPELHIHLADGKPMEITVPLSLSSHATVGKLEIADDTALAGKKCGSELMPKHAPALSSSKAIQAASNIRIIAVSTDADYQFHQRFGSQSNARVAAIINAAQVIYQNDLGIRFNIVRQRVRTTSSQPFTSSDSGALLNQYTDHINGEHGGADVSHLFTGKDLNDGVIGIAWLGVICNIPSLSTSLTQHVSSTIDPLVFAHEIGHNLDADHDNSTSPRSLMYPSVSSDQGFVSQKSRNEISNHIGQHGSCLTETDEPAPDPRVGGSESVSVAPTFSRRNGRLKLTVKRSGFAADESCSVRVSLAANTGMTGARSKTFTSSSNRLFLSALTSQRISAGKIYVRARVYNCQSTSADVTSNTRVFNPKGTRGVSATKWISGVARRLR